MSGFRNPQSGSFGSENNAAAYFQVDTEGMSTGIIDYLDPAALAAEECALDTLTAARNTLRHALALGNTTLAAEMRGVIASEQ